jgi:hypothetical protein
MGQGTDSCGGYDFDYDPYDEGLANGEWTTKTGGGIHVSQMSVRHLEGALLVAQRAKRNATFDDQREKWEDWIELFERELSHRAYAPAAPKVIKAPQPVRGKTVTMICHCKAEYEARQADLNRGYGKSCSKRCAAIRRDYKRPAGKPKVT